MIYVTLPSFSEAILKLFSLMLAFLSSLTAYGSVVVTLPANGATYGPNVPFTATASTSTCILGVAAMGVYVDDSLYYVTYGINMSTTLTLPKGKHRTVVQAWDFCGGATTTPLGLTITDQAGVTISAPSDGATVGTPASFAASATSSCPTGVAAMGIYVGDTLVYTTLGSSLSAQIPMTPGTKKVSVQEWDLCGGSTSTPLSLTVAGTTISNLQSSTNWNQWGELPPIYDICSLVCDGVTWSMTPHQSAISLSGDATRFTIGGTTPYSDVLWSNPVIGQGNTTGLKDAPHKLLPKLHNFALDTDVYVTNFAITQDLEFDINMYADGVGMEWGTQCNHLADGAWDLWDNVNRSWFSSGIPCALNDQAWNHVTLLVQRETNNDVTYQSITVNGLTSVINKTVAPYVVPSGWWGMTVNYQMDGNYRMATNTTYVDNMNFTYW